MKETADACGKCRINSTCSPSLIPERTKYLFGGGDTIVTPYNSDNCRHYTCPTGMEYALIALSEGTLEEISIVDQNGYTNKTDAYPFGTNHKLNGRMVLENGRIVSQQDNVYYFTGQQVTPAK